MASLVEKVAAKFKQFKVRLGAKLAIFSGHCELLNLTQNREFGAIRKHLT
jgi:hypothetical protein